MRAFIFGCTLLFSTNLEGAQRPNILLLMAEDLSSRVGAFEDDVAQTPHLNALARQGVRYDQVFTTSGVCAPSRAAHILGMHQIATGTQHMRASSAPTGAYISVPPPQVKAYPELLRAAGYYTYTDNKLDYQISGAWDGSGPFSIWSREGVGATAWRLREQGQPFFGFINFIATHESGVFRPVGDMPESWVHLMMQLMRWYMVGDVETVTDPAIVPLPPYYPDTDTVRVNVARHYDNIAKMDAQIGEILQQLAADDLAEDTIVIWTTDHGDGLPRGKRELYDSGIRVPMIIRWPEKFRPADVRPGTLDSRLISFVDLAPTILALARVDAPDYLHGNDFSDPHGVRREYVYAARDRIDSVRDRQRAVRDRRYKYIRSWYPEQAGGHPLEFRDNMDMVREMRAMYEAEALNATQGLWFEGPGEEQLYDLQADPYEVNNLADDPSRTRDLKRLRAALDAHLTSRGDWSDVPEAEMAEGFLLEGEQRVTPTPTIELQGLVLTLKCSESAASLAYRINSGAWRIYTGPTELDGEVREQSKLEAKAVRYGWKDSETVRRYF